MGDRPAEPSTVEPPRLDGVLGFGAYRFDAANRILYQGASEVPLQPRVLGVLEHLLAYPGQVVAKQDLMDAVWADTAVAESSLLEAVKILRRTLGDDPQKPTYIQTVHRRGYRLIAPVALHGGGLEANAVRLASRITDAVTRGARFVARRERQLLWALVLVSVVVASASTIRYRSLSEDTDGPRPTLRLQVSLPPDYPLATTTGLKFDISPDGSRLVYSALNGEDGLVLVIWELGESRATPIPGTEQASTFGNHRQSPTFSPDGNWVAFVAGTKVKKVSLQGGMPETVVDIEGAGFPGRSGVRVATWEKDGMIYFIPDNDAPGDPGIYRVDASGGEFEAVVEAEGHYAYTYYFPPDVLPGGKNALLRGPGPSTSLVDLDTGEQRVLLEGADWPRYVPSGHLVYVRDNSLRARPFDPSTLELGEPDVQVPDANWATSRFSSTGTLVQVGTVTTARGVVSLDRNGATSWIKRAGCESASLSPDGTKLALGCDHLISVYDLDRGTEMFPREVHAHSPIWTPDGERLVYSSLRDGRWRIAWSTADGSGSEETLLESDYPVYPGSVSPDGKVIAFMEEHPETFEDIWLLPVEGDREPRPFVRTEDYESGPKFSPDGHWIAYHSSGLDGWQVFVRPHSGPGSRTQVSVEEGGWPAWSRDGMELFYVTADGKSLMVVELADEPMFTPSKPRVVFETAPGRGWAGDRSGVCLDVSPDGQQLFARSYVVEPRTEVTIVFNWFEELKQLVPVGR